MQFAYKIEDFGKIVILRYHLKSFYIGRRLFLFSFISIVQRYKNIANEKRSYNDFFFRQHILRCQRTNKFSLF